MNNPHQPFCAENAWLVTFTLPGIPQPALGVSSLNSYVGAVVLTQGPGVTLTPSGNGLLISATGVDVVTGNLTDSTSGADGISIVSGTNAVFGPGTQIAQSQATTSTNGYLSSTDWNTFNNKQDTLSPADFTDSTAGTDGITITGGTASVLNAVSIAQAQAGSAQNGFLSSTDWNTFNAKQNPLTFINSIVNSGGNVSLVNDNSTPGNSQYYGTNTGGTKGFYSLPTVVSGNLTDSSGSADGITVVGGTGAVLGAGTSISQAQSSSSQNGYLSFTDWSTFNAKQSALTFSNSLVNNTGTVTLVNDSTPTADQYYGTNGSSVLGYHNLPVVVSSNLTDSTSGADGISITGGTGAVLGFGTSIAQRQANGADNGYLSSTDWNTFNNKQSTLTFVRSIANSGGTVALVNDSVPTASQYYGTNVSSVLGYYNLPGGISGAGTAGQVTYWSGASAITSSPNFLWDGTNYIFKVGDPTNAANGTVISLDDTAQLIKLGNDSAGTGLSINSSASQITAYKGAANSLLINTNNHAVSFGDISSAANGTKFILSDTAQSYTFSKGKISIDGVAYVFPAAQAGAPGDVLTNDSAGNLSWAPAGGGGVTFADSLVNSGGTVTLVNDSASPTASQYYGTNGSSVLGYHNLPAGATGNLTDSTAGGDGITITGGTGAVNGAGTSIAQAQATNSQNGYLSSTDWTTFNSKLTSTLTSAHIFVGNGSNVAASVAMSGDVNISNTGSTSIVATTNGTLTSLTALTTAASLATVGTITSGTWNATVIGIAYGGTGQNTAQLAINALAGGVTNGYFLQGNGTNIVLAPFGASTIPVRPVTTQAFGTTLNLTAALPYNLYDIEFTGSTGAAGVLLPTGTNAPIGSVAIVSDLDAVSDMYNITVDAGVGNAIVGVNSAQTYVLAAPGSVVTFVKVTATQWKAQ